MSPKVLVLSRNYPNSALPFLGLWVEGLVRHTQADCDVRVMSPVPYCPPLPSRFGHYGKYRDVPHHQVLNGINVVHPRFLSGPGYSLHALESQTYAWGVRRSINQLREQFPFDLIHAHCIYPDGVVAMQLGERYQVPVVITEHALWHPWLDLYPRVRHQAVRAAQTCAAHILASRGLQACVIRFTGQSIRIQSIPIGVDSSIFTLPASEQVRQANHILYVGQIKFSKGVDVLLKAMRQLSQQRPDIKLRLVGGSLWGYPSQEEIKLRSLAQEFGLQNTVEFVGLKSPPEVAALMQTSALLVLPSLRESFGAVLVEALACGTPVVATRCGGPEDIVQDSVGVLVPTNNEAALVDAIAQVVDRRQTYDPVHLRRYAVQHYAWQVVAKQTVKLYETVLATPKHSVQNQLLSYSSSRHKGEKTWKQPLSH